MFGRVSLVEFLRDVIIESEALAPLEAKPLTGQASYF